MSTIASSVAPISPETVAHAWCSALPTQAALGLRRPRGRATSRRARSAGRGRRARRRHGTGAGGGPRPGRAARRQPATSTIGASPAARPTSNDERSRAGAIRPARRRSRPTRRARRTGPSASRARPARSRPWPGREQRLAHRLLRARVQRACGPACAPASAQPGLDGEWWPSERASPPRGPATSYTSTTTGRISGRLRRALPDQLGDRVVQVRLDELVLLDAVALEVVEHLPAASRTSASSSSAT